MKHRIFFSALLMAIVFLPACSDGDALPKGILGKDKMMSVMEDMGKAEEYVNSYTARDTALKVKDESIRLYNKIFKQYGITRQQFNQSFDYYLSKPQLAKDMFDSLSAKLRRTSYSGLGKGKAE
jgi:hypothetical protein